MERLKVRAEEYQNKYEEYQNKYEDAVGRVDKMGMLVEELQGKMDKMRDR